MTLFHLSLEKPNELSKQVDKLILEASEKYGFPVKIDNDTYWPKSIVKWKEENNLSAEELAWLDDRFKWYEGFPNTKPGEWWNPSYHNCY